MKLSKEDWKRIKNDYQQKYHLQTKVIDKYFKKNDVLTESKLHEYIKSLKMYEKKRAFILYRKIESTFYCDPDIWEISKKYSATAAYAKYCYLFHDSEIKLENVEKLSKNSHLTNLSQTTINNYCRHLRRLYKFLEKTHNIGYKIDNNEQSQALLYAKRKTCELENRLTQKQVPELKIVDGEIFYARNVLRLLFKIYESHFINYRNEKGFIK